METVAEPRLLDLFQNFGNVESLDNRCKAALRLCNKQIKTFIDATVISCKLESKDLNALLSSVDWHVKKLVIEEKTIPAEPVKTLPVALVTKFPQLETLSPGNCFDLVELPRNIGELMHLKFFRMESLYAVKTLPMSFMHLSSLERLELIFCGQLTFPCLAPLKHLQQLKYLILKGTPMEDLDLDDLGTVEWICQNISHGLKELVFDWHLLSFPPSITNLTSLTRLYLRGLKETGIDEVPETICSLSVLQELSLDSPLPLVDDVSKLTALRNLSIPVRTHSNILLQQFTCLTELHLDIWENNEEYESLNSLSILKSLKVLGLKAGVEYFNLLPEAIRNLQNLDVLELSYHAQKVESLPDSIGDLMFLKEFKLGNCYHLKRLPESFGNLIALEKIVLVFCHVLTLPESIANLEKLQVLEVLHCHHFSGLPSSIGNLKSLEHLVVRNCEEFSELPDSINGLVELKVLEIKNCKKFISLPASFADLVLGKPPVHWSLERVDFRGCQVEIFDKNEQAFRLLKKYGVYKGSVRQHSVLSS